MPDRGRVDVRPGPGTENRGERSARPSPPSGQPRRAAQTVRVTWMNVGKSRKRLRHLRCGSWITVFTPADHHGSLEHRRVRVDHRYHETNLVHLKEVLSNFTRATQHLIDARELPLRRPVEQVSEPGVRVLRQPNRKLTPIEIDELVRRYQAGSTMSGLAKEYGMHFQTVRAHLRRGEVSLRSEQPALTQKQIDEAVALYAQGWSTYLLGERYRVDRSTVGQALRRSGVAMRSSAGTRSRGWQAPGAQ